MPVKGIAYIKHCTCTAANVTPHVPWCTYTTPTLFAPAEYHTTPGCHLPSSFQHIQQGASHLVTQFQKASKAQHTNQPLSWLLPCVVPHTPCMCPAAGQRRTCWHQVAPWSLTLQGGPAAPHSRRQSGADLCVCGGGGGRQGFEGVE
jgi:hypothetical protein